MVVNADIISLVVLGKLHNFFGRIMKELSVRCDLCSQFLIKQKDSNSNNGIPDDRDLA